MKALHYFAAIFLLIGIGSCSKEGPEGPIGPRGEKGDTGERGAKGEDGTMLRYGTGAPGASLGDEGDFYIDMASSNLYGPKTNGGWGTAANIKGDKGDTGARGATGAKGDKGDTGARGATGAKGDKGDKGDTGARGATGTNGQDGSQFLSGTAVPTSQGKVGDFYFHTTTATLYGPKTSVGWGLGISLKGAKGDKGDKGDDGNANVRKYSFIIKKDEWGQGGFSESNQHNFYRLSVALPEVTFNSQRYVILAYVRPIFTSAISTLKKQVPYTLGVNNNYGIKFEFELNIFPSILMSKTTNGWNNQFVPLAERPETVQVEIIMIEINMMSVLQGKLDFKDINAVTEYFNLD